MPRSNDRTPREDGGGRPPVRSYSNQFNDLRSTDSMIGATFFPRGQSDDRSTQDTLDEYDDMPVIQELLAKVRRVAEKHTLMDDTFGEKADIVKTLIGCGIGYDSWLVMLRMMRQSVVWCLQQERTASPEDLTDDGEGQEVPVGVLSSGLLKIPRVSSVRSGFGGGGTPSSAAVEASYVVMSSMEGLAKSNAKEHFEAIDSDSKGILGLSEIIEHYNGWAEQAQFAANHYPKTCREWVWAFVVRLRMPGSMLTRKGAAELQVDMAPRRVALALIWVSFLRAVMVVLLAAVVCVESLAELHHDGVQYHYSRRSSLTTFALTAAAQAWFTLEFVLYCVGYPYGASRFFRELRTWVDLVSLAPFYAMLIDHDRGGAAQGDWPKLFYAARISRVIRLLRVLLAVKWQLFGSDARKELQHPKILTTLSRAWIPLLWFFLLVGTFCCMAATLLFYAELDGASWDTAQGKWVRPASSELGDPPFQSIPDAMWWAVVTLSTVGYGDVYPVTATGKLVGSATIMMSTMFIIPFPVVIIGNVVGEAYSKQNADVRLTQLRRDFHTGLNALLKVVLGVAGERRTLAAAALSTALHDSGPATPAARRRSAAGRIGRRWHGPRSPAGPTTSVDSASRVLDPIQLLQRISQCVEAIQSQQDDMQEQQEMLNSRVGHLESLITQRFERRAERRASGGVTILAPSPGARRARRSPSGSGPAPALRASAIRGSTVSALMRAVTTPPAGSPAAGSSAPPSSPVSSLNGRAAAADDPAENRGGAADDLARTGLM